MAMHGPTSPPDEPTWLRIPMDCHCGWDGDLEDCMCNDRAMCPECEEYLGMVDYIIKTAGEE